MEKLESTSLDKMIAAIQRAGQPADDGTELVSVHLTIQRVQNHEQHEQLLSKEHLEYNAPNWWKLLNAKTD